MDYMDRRIEELSRFERVINDLKAGVDPESRKAIDARETSDRLREVNGDLFETIYNESLPMHVRETAQSKRQLLFDIVFGDEETSGTASIPDATFGHNRVLGDPELPMMGNGPVDEEFSYRIPQNTKPHFRRDDPRGGAR